MSELSQEHQAVLDKQVADWTKELRRLASQIAAAKGVNCAVVLITGNDEGYADVVPELILEDALRVNPHGWPAGFSIDLLNPST
jgi:hypothetical protein